MDRYAVMGNPIAHSKSPKIHAAFAKQTGQELTYDAILVPENGFAEAVSEFRLSGGKGLNITVPFKEQAWQLVDERAPRAEKAGAVNTIIVQQAGLLGDNTDGVGLTRDLRENHGVELQGKRILVLGAGGAVRGVLGPLLSNHPAELVIANRTQSKAQTLAELFADEGKVIAAGFTDALAEHTFDVIINGTSASLQGDVPPIPPACARDVVCYDMMYAVEPTPFLRWAEKNGASRTIDGLGMLVEQAAESFYLWRGVRPQTGIVIDQVRAS